MKKVNENGFTLIELLAVIVIMGILMMVAIPAVSRTIENARKDTFIDIAKSYANAVVTLWTADGLTCGVENTVSSAVDDGEYYIEINTAGKAISDDLKTLNGEVITVPTILEQGGNSSWGNRDVAGYVRVSVRTTPVWCSLNTTHQDFGKWCKSSKRGCYKKSNISEWEPCVANDAIVMEEGKRIIKYYVALSDGTHGIRDNISSPTESSKLVRGQLDMTGVNYIKIPVNSNKCVEN